MLIGIISDTHNRLAAAEQALQLLHARGVQQVIHCGDWTTVETMRQFIEYAAELGITVQGVLGNNDKQAAEMMKLLAQLPHGQHVVQGLLELRIAGVTLAACHGHHLPTRNRMLADTSYDAVFLGHSHKPRDEYLSNGLHVINPGSTAFAIPRRKGWQASVVIYDTVGKQAEFIYIERPV